MVNWLFGIHPKYLIMRGECLYTVYLTSLTQMASPAQSLLLRNSTHTGPIRGLDFSPIQTNLLSSGGINGEVSISITTHSCCSNLSSGLHMGSQRSQQAIFAHSRNSQHQTRRNHVSRMEPTSATCPRRLQQYRVYRRLGFARKKRGGRACLRRWSWDSRGSG